MQAVKTNESHVNNTDRPYDRLFNKIKSLIITDDKLLKNMAESMKIIRMIRVPVGVGRSIKNVMEDDQIWNDILHSGFQYGILSVRNAYILTEVIIWQ